jgi:hypothetical protein
MTASRRKLRLQPPRAGGIAPEQLSEVRDLGRRRPQSCGGMMALAE